MLDGVQVKIGEREYVIPPLNVKSFKRAQALEPALSSEGPEAIDAAIEIIHLAVTRNYPDVTREQLEEDIDLGSLVHLITALLTIETGAQESKTVQQARPRRRRAPAPE